MNPAQQARTEGFLASLSVRGVFLRVPPDDLPLQVLLEPVAADEGQFSVARETGTGVRVHVLRDHLEGLIIGMGTVIKDPTSGFVYRVTNVDDNPAIVTVRFTREAAPVEPL